jgi:uncharacterized protein
VSERFRRRPSERGSPGREETIGVLSDTHGLVRPEALEALAGVEKIVHAGDVGGNEVLEALAKIASVTAVRGNTDHGPWATALPRTALVETEGGLLYVLHQLSDLDLEPSAAGVRVVIYGHSHAPSVEAADGVLYLNPGSAGPRRFRLPVTVAKLLLSPGKQPHAEILRLLA